MGSEGENLHIFVFPLMGAGHLLPAVDIAKLLASRGVQVSIIATRGNSPAIKQSILLFPTIDVLLVQGTSPLLDVSCKHFSDLPPDKHMDAALSTSSLRPSLENLISLHRPDAIISDFLFPWTAYLGIPRLQFHGCSLFFLCLSEIINPSELSDGVNSFIVPGIPHRIELYRTQVFDPKKMRPDIAALFTEIMEAEERSYGTVVNSFYELEPDYADYYANVMKRKAWHVGPVSLLGDSAVSGTLRGGECDRDWKALSSWLDSKEEKSVLYVCFGSKTRFTEAQVREIAEGLESSGGDFIWVVKNEARWLPEGFQRRTKGIIVKGWATQDRILRRRAVGGFMTHCGWNSSLESVCNGVPVVTWPMFADQFYNERLLVDVLRVGVEVGVKTLSNREEEREVVKAEKIAEAVGRLMGKSREAEERRERARELKTAARIAFQNGGSSCRDVGRLIDDLVEIKKSK